MKIQGVNLVSIVGSYKVLKEVDKEAWLGPIDYLKAVDLNIIPRRQCQRVYPFTRILPQFICTSGDLSQVDNQTLTLVKEIPVVP